MEGQRFGRLLVLRDSGFRVSRIIKWECLCDCGKTTTVCGTHLRLGTTKSCGCLIHEKHSEEHRKRTAHTRRRVGAVISKGYRGYVAAAKARGIEFSLTTADFLNLVAQDCNYCGSPPSMKKATMFERCLMNGVDRLDNGQGYTVNNCVPCCTRCNLMKHAFTVSEFLDHIARIYLFNDLWEVEKIA